MASPGNQHCANCIGTLSFPIATYVWVEYKDQSNQIKLDGCCSVILHSSGASAR